MANLKPELHIENLKPLNKRTAKDRLRIAKMGAEASKKAQKETNSMKKLAKIIGNLAFKDSATLDRFKESVSNIPKHLSMEAALITSHYIEAIKGSSKSAIFIRDTKGEKPVDKQEIEQTTVNIEIKDKKVIDSVIDKIKNI